MITPLSTPQLGMVQDNITVTKWLKTDGDAVAVGEPVVVVESAKVSAEVEAPAAGLLLRLSRVNDKVRTGDSLGVIGDNPAELEQYKLAPSAGSEPQAAEADFFYEEEETEGVRISFAEGDEPPRPAPTGYSPPPPPASLELTGEEKINQRIPFLGMRRTIAQNLVASLQTGAQLTVVAAADMTELGDFRRELRLDNPDDKITYLDLLCKLVAAALAEFPIINSSLVGDEIICWGDYHLGVAVALDDGLVVPVVRNVDRKSLAAVSREIKRLSRKARQNALNPEDYQGGTFTISSGGKAEVEFMTPIINPPQNAILGVGRIAPKPAVHQGQLAVRTMTNLCLTHDHRVIDGLPAADFLGRLKELIERPELFRSILK